MSENKKKEEKWDWWIIGCYIFIAAFIGGAIYLNFVAKKSFFNLELNEMGDFLAGFIGGITALLFMISIRLQHKELKAQRDEFKAMNTQMEQDRKLAEKQYKLDCRIQERNEKIDLQEREKDQIRKINILLWNRFFGYLRGNNFRYLNQTYGAHDSSEKKVIDDVTKFLLNNTDPFSALEHICIYFYRYKDDLFSISMDLHGKEKTYYPSKKTNTNILEIQKEIILYFSGEYGTTYKDICEYPLSQICSFFRDYFMLNESFLTPEQQKEYQAFKETHKETWDKYFSLPSAEQEETE